MNRLKRNVLLGVGLSLLAMAGTAVAQEAPAQHAAQAPAPQVGAQPGSAAKGANKGAGPANVKPHAGMGPAAARPAPGQGRPPTESMTGAPGEGTRGGPPGAKGKGPDGAPGADGDVRKGPPAGVRVSPEERRAQLKAMREVRLAERDYYTIQQLRLQKGPEAASALAEAEGHQRQARRKAMNELRHAQKAQRENAKGLSKSEKQALNAKLNTASRKRAADRKERGEMERAALVKAHGAKLDKPAVQAELRRHAWRLARLTRLTDMAQAMGKDDLAAKAKALIEAENSKHEVRLNAFLADKMPELPPGFAMGMPAKAGTTAAGEKLKMSSEKKKAPEMPRPAASPAAKEGAQ